MTPNKFLNIYPQLRDPRIGDTVEVIKTINPRNIYYSDIVMGNSCKKGEIGIIVEMDDRPPNFLIKLITDKSPGHTYVPFLLKVKSDELPRFLWMCGFLVH